MLLGGKNNKQICFSGVSTLSSSKLGLAAGSSALSPPEMLFRTWGGGQGGHCTQRTRPRGVGADCQTVSTSQPDLSRLKTLTPARARRLGAEKTSPKKKSGCLISSRAGGKSESRICHVQDQATSYCGRGSRGTEAVLHCSACPLVSTNAALLWCVETSQAVAKPSQPLNV